MVLLVCISPKAYLLDKFRLLVVVLLSTVVVQLVVLHTADSLKGEWSLSLQTMVLL